MSAWLRVWLSVWLCVMHDVVMCSAVAMGVALTAIGVRRGMAATVEVISAATTGWRRRAKRQTDRRVTREGRNELLLRGRRGRQGRRAEVALSLAAGGARRRARRCLKRRWRRLIIGARVLRRPKPRHEADVARLLAAGLHTISQDAVVHHVCRWSRDRRALSVWRVRVDGRVADCVADCVDGRG